MGHYQGPLVLTRRWLAFVRAARNTRENALLAMALAQPQAGETWLLVTSAFHMPRAMGSFGPAGWRLLGRADRLFPGGDA